MTEVFEKGNKRQSVYEKVLEKRRLGKLLAI